MGFRGIAMDVTDARGREAERRQAQGMEIIGMLGGRIAHKFNNILGTIIGCTELSLFSIEEGTTVYRHLTEILKAGNLAKDLVGQILTISHHEEQYLRPVRVSLIIKEVIKNLQASSPATIKIQQRIETDSDMVQAVPTQIHQMLMNPVKTRHYFLDYQVQAKLLCQQILIDL